MINNLSFRVPLTDFRTCLQLPAEGFLFKKFLFESGSLSKGFPSKRFQLVRLSKRFASLELLGRSEVALLNFNDFILCNSDRFGDEALTSLYDFGEKFRL